MIRPVISSLLFFTIMTSPAAQEGTRSETVSAPGGQVTVMDFKGEVHARTADQTPVEVTQGLVLHANSVVETVKGRVLLQMQDGSQVLVNLKTRVVIKAPAESDGHWFDLLVGKVRAKVQKYLGDTAPFRLGTPTAVITVRGTDFTVEVDKKNKTSVYVYDGVVEFVGLGAPDRPVLIRPGFYSNATPDHPAEPPEPMNRNFEDRSGSPDSGDRTREEQSDDRQPNRSQSGSREQPDSSERQNQRPERPD